MKDRLYSFFKWDRDERPEIIEVRQRFYSQAVYPFIVFGLFAVVMGCLQASEDGQWGFAVLYAGSYLIFLFSARPGASYSLVFRSASLIFAIVVISFLVLVRIGLSGVGLELLVLAFALSSAMLGKKAGFILLGTGVLFSTIIGVGMVAGFIPVRMENMATSLSPLAWGTTLVVLAMVGVGLVMIPQMFLKRLVGSLTLLEERAAELERYNIYLKHNIEAREKAEKSLRESEQRFRSITEQITEAVYVTDREGIITYISPVSKGIFGVSSEEMIGQHFSRFLSEESMEAAFDAFSKIVEKGLPLNNQMLLLKRKDGSTFWGEFSGRDYVIQGAFVGSIGIIRDITEKKRMEDALFESGQRMALALHGAALGTWDWNVVTGEATFNDRWAEMLGYQLEEIQLNYKTWEEMVHPEDIPRVSMALNAHLEGRLDTYEVEHRLRHKSGEWLWVLTKGLVIERNDDGQALRVCGTHLDISDRKQAEEALFESEARYRTLFESAGDAIFLETKEGYIDCNTKTLELFGCRREDIIGHSPLDFSPVVQPDGIESAEKVKKYVKAVMSGLTQVFEWKHSKLDGTLFDTEVSLNLVELPSGPHILAMVRDISERKLAEQEREEQQDLIDNIMTASSIGISYARNREIIWANKAMEDLFGFTHESDYVGQDTRILYPTEEEYRRIGQILYDDTLKGQVTETDAIFGRKDGTIFYGLLRINFLTENDPEKGRIVSILDITERKRAEEALKEREENYRLLADNITDNIWTFDLESLCFSYVSPSVVDITGFTAEESMNRQLNEVLTPSSYEAATRLLEEELVNDHLADPSRSRTLEMEQFHKDGSIVWTEVSMSFIRDQSGRPISVLGVTRDISERKKLQSQLLQAQKMETVGTLAGGIAHDFNNILQAVLGYSELARQKVTTGKNVQHELDMVIQASNRASDLVKHILAFSRQNEPERKPLDMGLIVKEALNLLRASVPTTIEIRQEIGDTSDRVLADPTQLHQVIMNLCTNAAQAMKEHGGQLDVILASVTVDEFLASQYTELNPGRYLKLTVSDTGHGMDKETLARIFDPFFTTKEHGEGTGMGMSVVHGIVKNHGGAISVYSEPGKGSTFNVYFPVLDSGDSLLPIAPEPAVLATGTEHILFVDDEASLVEVACEMLELLGYKVTSRASSLEALELFRHDPYRFDLIITDQTMPQMTGVNLAKEVMKIRQDIPVILCTGFSAVITPEKARTVGIREFVMKPLLIEQLAGKIRNVLDAEKDRRPAPQRPIFPGPKTAVQAKAAVVRPSRFLKILLADDDQLSRRLAVSNLEKTGHLVVPVENGKEALVVHSRENFDLIIMDVEMPVMDGIQATAAIREKEKSTGSYIPIIAMTGHTSEEDKKRLREAGMDVVLSKPVGFAELNNTIEKIVNKDNSRD